MRVHRLLGTFVLAAVGLSAQATQAPSDPARAIVGRLELGRSQAHIKGSRSSVIECAEPKVIVMPLTGLRNNSRALGTSTSRRQRFMSG